MKFIIELDKVAGDLESHISFPNLFFLLVAMSTNEAPTCCWYFDVYITPPANKSYVCNLIWCALLFVATNYWCLPLQLRWPFRKCGCGVRKTETENTTFKIWKIFTQSLIKLTFCHSRNVRVFDILWNILHFVLQFSVRLSLSLTFKYEISWKMKNSIDV